MRFENYREIGRYLRNSRERQGWSVQDIAEVLHIRGRYLEALEEGLLSELPGNAYVRGYLKLYAQVLRLNTEAIIDNFQSVARLKPADGFFLPEPTRKEYKPDANMVYFSLGLIATIYLSWAIAFKAPSLDLPRVEFLPTHLIQADYCGTRFCN